MCKSSDFKSGVKLDEDEPRQSVPVARMQRHNLTEKTNLERVRTNRLFSIDKKKKRRRRRKCVL